MRNMTSILGVIEMRVMAHLRGFDHRNRWFGTGRTILAIGNLITLVFTPIQALIVPIGDSSGAVCTNIRAASLLCVGDPHAAVDARRWVMIVILIIVASGYRPRWTALPHAWVAFTIGGSITLPDGGDAIALTMTLLVLPMALADDRTWHWDRTTTALSATWRAICSISLLAVRAQLAFIYLDSAITKFAVDDWSNGTAEFYILRDPGFGDAGFLHTWFQQLSAEPVVALTMSWGAIVVEIAIGLALLLSWRWRVLALVLDLALHAMIVLTMGLFSFSAVMVGSAAIAANPAGAQEAASNRFTGRATGSSIGRRSRSRSKALPEPATTAVPAMETVTTAG
jgi:antimicrobial peptide system SdpB family protein